MKAVLSASLSRSATGGRSFHGAAGSSSRASTVNRSTRSDAERMYVVAAAPSGELGARLIGRCPFRLDDDESPQILARRRRLI